MGGWGVGITRGFNVVLGPVHCPGVIYYRYLFYIFFLCFVVCRLVGWLVLGWEVIWRGLEANR